MFPNQSSSYEISKTYAFVQINEEGRLGDVNGMAQPHISNNPPLQVPDKRDEMVVKGDREGDPSLTVITGHPSHAPAKIPSALEREEESDGSSIMPRVERQQTGALCFDSIKSSSSINNINLSNKDFINNAMKKCPSQSETLSNIPQTNDDADYSFKICDLNNSRREGIGRCLRLRGGGESSLTTGTDGWGTPPSGAPGWNIGGPNQQQGQTQQQLQNSASGGGGGNQSGQPQQWGPGSGGGSGNNNTNRQGGQANAGSGQQTQVGPTSQTQAPATTPASIVTTSVNNTATTQSSSNPAVSGSNSVSSQPPVGTAGNQNGGSGGSANGGTQQSGSQSGGAGGASWAQAAGKGLPANSQGGTSTTNSVPNNTTSTKQQMEQLNTMREALFSQDGWGGQNVNQDSHWDIPGSPEPGSKENNNSAPTPVLKVPVNNGTELWEANLRNGGIPPPQNQAQKTPWGHTPSSNIGGTWGEEDEGDTSNVWTGVPPAAAGSAPQWSNQPQPIWPGGGGTKKDGDWGGPNWNEQRDPREIRHGEMRQIIDARDNMRPASMDHRNMGGNEVLMRGDTRGISGRLNGVNNDTMWSAGPTPHHHMPHHQGKIPNHPNQPGVNQWGGSGVPPMKEMASLAGKSTGWEEPSPPAQRRNMPNYDDGTSLWGQQHSRPAMPGQNKVSHWKEMPAPGGMGRGLTCPPGRGGNPNMKPDQPLWPHHPRNVVGWAEGGGMDVGGPWNEDKPAPWMDQSLNPSTWQTGPKHKPNWDNTDLDSSPWVGHQNKQPAKTITKEVIWASKQFRILTEMGYKKEEVENALRTSGLSLEEALELLNASRSLGGDRWRHTDIEDHSLMNAYPSPQQPICIPFQTNGGGGGGGSGTASGNALTNANPSLSNLSPAIMQKLLSQQTPTPAQQQLPFTQSSRTQQTQQPSPQQLRMLVQQIQMAVQGGYLSPQILNQPLAPQTLLLLNQLLQQIKTLQQLVQHNATVMQVGNPLGKSSIMQISVQITKTKQQISNLQNQIAATQAVYVKHQQQTPPSASDFFKTPIHEPMTTLHSNFSDLTLKESQVSGSSGSQQSRLNQWKLPALDKDQDMASGNDFSRAPGTTTKTTPGNSSPNINPLLGQPDGTWSSVNRNNCDTGWPDSGTDDSSSKDWPTSTQPPSQAFHDLVPEFEPGKPWKGNPLKSIEDDPSMTPGSVVRSPLSLPSIKDTHILSSSSSSSVQGKASPPTSSAMEVMPLSLSSSTWSFNPPVSSTKNSDMFDSSGLNKVNNGGKNGGSGGVSGGNSGGGGGTWGDGGVPGSGGSGQSVGSSSELWAPKSRGPPPGLSGKPQSAQGGQGGGQQSQGNNNGAPTSNGWLSSSRWPQSSWSHLATSGQTGSSWLLLKNLTPQIDGSTLKTLCVQHGPLQNFHLYLNQGIALAKYASREEASKAQGALNNCVLGNTTIFAESPSESDVLSMLPLGMATSGGGGTSGVGAWRPGPSKEPSWASSGGGGGAGASSQGLWGGAGAGSGGGASLWGDAADQHRTTPSSINSYLPGDLLGGESL